MRRNCCAVKPVEQSSNAPWLELLHSRSFLAPASPHLRALPESGGCRLGRPTAVEANARGKKQGGVFRAAQSQHTQCTLAKRVTNNIVPIPLDCNIKW